jgi:hypothetical protein
MPMTSRFSPDPPRGHQRAGFVKRRNVAAWPRLRASRQPPAGRAATRPIVKPRRRGAGLDARRGLGQYVAAFGNHDITYGSLGAVMILLTWRYLSGFIAVAGGELKRRPRGRPGTRATGSARGRPTPAATFGVVSAAIAPASSLRGVRVTGADCALRAQPNLATISAPRGASAMARMMRETGPWWQGQSWAPRRKEPFMLWIWRSLSWSSGAWASSPPSRWEVWFTSSWSRQILIVLVRLALGRRAF